jgi:hypothetical protein
VKTPANKRAGLGPHPTLRNHWEFLPPSAAEQTNQLNLAGKRLREVFQECLACANYPHALASVISILHLYGEYPERAEPKGWAEEGEKTLNRREMPAKSENRQTTGV